MDIDENGNYVLSRKLVQKEALNWFENETKVQRQKHTNSENLMCDGLHFLIDSLYSEKALPLLATVPRKCCPFCGIELPQGFRTENWWEKEFKTFKWWKDRGLCE